MVKDVDGSYLINSGCSASGADVLPLRMLYGTAMSSRWHDAVSDGVEAAAAGCGAIAGCLSGSSPMCCSENLMAISRYIGICDSVVYMCAVDTAAVVVGAFGSAGFDTACLGVVASDAGTIWIDLGSAGDAVFEAVEAV